MLKYDSVHGKLNNVTFKNDSITVGNKTIKVFNEKNPSSIKWGSLDTDIVCESTGVFLSNTLAMGHIEGGAKKVILSAPTKKDDTPMYV